MLKIYLELSIRDINIKFVHTKPPSLNQLDFYNQKSIAPCLLDSGSHNHLQFFATDDIILYSVLKPADILKRITRNFYS